MVDEPDQNQTSILHTLQRRVKLIAPKSWRIQVAAEPRLANAAWRDVYNHERNKTHQRISSYCLSFFSWLINAIQHALVAAWVSTGIFKTNLYHFTRRVGE